MKIGSKNEPLQGEVNNKLSHPETRAGRPGSYCQKTGRGFTLIELLVVIAIIGILASLLFPVLVWAKGMAVRTVDMNNLRQMIMGLTMYSNDNQDNLPWSNWLNGDAPNRIGWLYTLNTQATGSAQFDPRTGALWTTLLSSNMYFCPRDQSTVTFKLRDQQCSTYVMNGAVNGYGRAVYPPIKMSQMPPDGVVFWEPDETNIANFNDGASSPNEGLTARHAQSGAYGVFSGAAAFMKQSLWNAGVSQTNANQFWCYPDSPNGR